MRAFYNENDPYCAQWLRNLIAAGHIPAGDVDDRSIVEVSPIDIVGYTQVHLFAGIAGWALAARLAGWPDGRPLWTASCPCQPFSVAGKGLGANDPRHLWPHVFRLVRAARPAVLMGEQVAAAVGKNWFDGVRANMESVGYAARGVVVPACAVDAPHGRDRLYFVADASSGRRSRPSEGEVQQPGRAEVKRGSHVDVADANAEGRLQPQGRVADVWRWIGDGGGGALADARGPEWWADSQRRFDVFDGSDIGRPETPSGFAVRGACGVGDSAQQQQHGCGYARPRWWDEHSDSSCWILGADGKARRVKPGVRLLAHGIPARVAKLRAGGNAIVPPLAAEVIAAYMDCEP